MIHEGESADWAKIECHLPRTAGAKCEARGNCIYTPCCAEHEEGELIVEDCALGPNTLPASSEPACHPCLGTSHYVIRCRRLKYLNGSEGVT